MSKIMELFEKTAGDRDLQVKLSEIVNTLIALYDDAYSVLRGLGN